ncbi:MAG: cation:proton antiporter subunit C [Acidobacteria bacterium]|nr:cation:proton antiporter subunit C [Acidobacteriota bacterium]MDA1234016.1 cation:proton antiporter subunit C [Acidobacteriota bacterium]
MLDVIEALLRRPNFVAFVTLFLWGLYITVVHHNLVKKLIGLYLVQTSVIFFLVTTSVKSGATVPIVDLAAGTAPEVYMNPLPHALTLTAIVVQVATLGVSLALVAAIYRRFGSLDENEILKRLE